ncbi:MAG: SDR family NAD(P)-dependent oxidoreductase [Spirochaetaceae bacterium]|nr:SDR family NAD(P)-dependent oxidoreductase [Spirochaetaceae bacterium]
MEPNNGSGRLAGKVAIVTGGGAREGTELGTGRASAVAMAREGARVLVADLHQENAERTVAEIRAEGGEAEAFAADVSQSEQCAAMAAAAVERFGALHVLMNNCGAGGTSGTVSGMDEAILERSLNVNLKSAIFSSKHAIPHMAAAGGGSIINVSSVDGLTAGMMTNAPYGIAKGALHMLTKTTAVYHGREGIRANCIAPGHLHAAFTDKFPDRTRDLRRRAGPLGTEGTAWDIAWTAVFLASDEARWISGVVLPVDGGLLAAAPLTAYAYLEDVKYL